MNLRIIASVLAGVLQVSMPENPSASTWLLLGAVAVLIAGYLLRQRKRVAVLAVTAGFAVAVVGRVAVETANDPTSHNLWPFEVVIAGGIGLVAAVLGVGLARLLQRATG